MVRWFVLKGLCGPPKLFGNFFDFSIICSLFEAIFSKYVAKELGKVTLGNISCPVNNTVLSGPDGNKMDETKSSYSGY